MSNHKTASGLMEGKSSGCVKSSLCWLPDEKKNYINMQQESVLSFSPAFEFISSAPRLQSNANAALATKG